MSNVSPGTLLRLNVKTFFDIENGEFWNQIEIGPDDPPVMYLGISQWSKVAIRILNQRTYRFLNKDKVVLLDLSSEQFDQKFTAVKL